MALTRKKVAAITAGVCLIPCVMYLQARGSDHADTPAIAAQPGADLTDVFVFPSPANANNVVLVMNVHPLIPSGQSATVSFDPSVLYQFKIDNTGDGVEDLVIQARFVGTGPNQKVLLTSPVKPDRIGTVTTFVGTTNTRGAINQTFTPAAGITAFAGAREDPFFFDLDQFFTIFPDRKTPLNGVTVANPNQPQAASWRPPGTAVDFLAGFNVLSIVVELPKSTLVGAGTGKIGVWCTTSK